MARPAAGALRFVGERGTQSVVGLAANACGLYDMSGNAWEWVDDWWQIDDYTHAGRTDPTSPETGTLKMGRGGSAT